jgi:hypothetical protein
LQAKVFDDALDTARADLQAGLSDFLCDHRSRRVRVEEAVPNDLTGHLVGTAVLAFGSASLAREGLGAMELQGFTNLGVPRLAEAEGLSRLARTKGITCAFDEHRQLSRDVVLFEDGKGAMRSNEPMLITIKCEHDPLLRSATHRKKAAMTWG